MLHRLDLPVLESWAILGLQVVAVTSFASLMAVLIGRWAMVPTWLFFIVLGNSSSGGAVAPPLLPAPLAFGSQWLPSGATVTALRDAVYFHGYQQVHPIAVLATWAAALFSAMLGASLWLPKPRESLARRLGVLGAPGDPGSGRAGHVGALQLMAGGVLSGLFGQSAFHGGPLALSKPVIHTVEPVAWVTLGAAVFGERLARSPGLLALQLTGGATATGIAVLSHSPVTLAEQRRDSQAAGGSPDRPPDRPPAKGTELDGLFLCGVHEFASAARDYRAASRVYATT